MPISARTYTCGDAGGVRKLVDLTGPWVDVALPSNGIVGAAQSHLFDVETDPNNGDKVFVVGEGYCSAAVPNWYGIAFSSNGGLLWQVPTGNYQNLVNNINCYYKWNEISVVDSNVIYVCGDVDVNTNKGIVAKSLDGGATFNVCAPLPAVVDGMNATAIHFITPLIGVVGLNDYVLRTTDGGATWLVMNNGFALSSSNPAPASPPVAGQITGIYISDDLGYIVGITPSAIVETIPVVSPNPPSDAGVGANTWKNNFFTAGVPVGFNNLPIGYHLAYIKNPLAPPLDGTVSITGYSSLGILTADQSNSWVVVPPPGYDPSGNGFTRIAAHFYKALPPAYNIQHGFYSKNSDVYHNTNNFDGGVETFSETSPYGVQAIWTWYQESPPEPTCYLLTDCSDPANQIVTNTNLAANVGQVAAIVGYSGCYIISVAPDCTGAVPVTIVTLAPDCQNCNQTCYLLEDCEDNLPDIVTSTNLSTYVGQVITLSDQPGVCWQVSLAQGCSSAIVLNGTVTNNYTNCINCLNTCYLLTDCAGGANPITILTTTDLSLYVGKSVQLSNYPGICWAVTAAPDCTGATPLTSSVTAQFTDCPSCLQKCYRLVDCTGQNPDVITSTDLASYVGSIIKIKGCPDTCWTVLNVDTCAGSSPITFESVYASCTACLGVVIPDIVLKTRSVYPNYGNDQAGCSIEYIEKVNCNFVEQVYRKMIVKRHGIKACEEDYYNKWLIKKMLLDLDLTYDAKACKKPGCCAPCGVSVELIVSKGVVCPAPTGVSAELIFPIDCDPPQNISASISF